MKAMNKGEIWNGTVVNIKKAKLELNEEAAEEMKRGNWVAKSQKQQPSLVIRKAQRLAESF
eukprot:9182639-Prorocentrum_lima.AAC.1